jgi:hypothetical protein
LAAPPLFSAFKVSAKNGLFLGQMTSGRRAGCGLKKAWMPVCTANAFVPHENQQSQPY